MDSTENLFNILNTYQGFNLTLWNFYIAVILGLLGYAIGSDKAQEWSIRVVLVIAFSGFAWGNLSFLERNQILIKGLAEEIVTKQKDSEISASLSSVVTDWATMQPESLKILHLLIDVGVVLLLLFGPTIANSFRSRSAGD